MIIHINGVEVTGEAASLQELLGLTKKQERCEVSVAPRNKPVTKKRRGRRPKNFMVPYTDEQKAFIADNMETMSIPAMAKALERKVTSVNSMAWRIKNGLCEGYRKNNQEEEKEDDILF